MITPNIPIRVEGDRKIEYDFLYQLTEDFGEEAGDGPGVSELLRRAAVPAKDCREMVFNVAPEGGVLSKEQFYCLMHLVAFYQQGRRVAMSELKSVDSDQVPDIVFEGIHIPKSEYRRVKNEERKSIKRNKVALVKIDLLEDEKQKDTLSDVDLILINEDLKTEPISGSLSITNFRLVWNGDYTVETSHKIPIMISTPFTSIQDMDSEVTFNEKKSIHLICKDLRNWTISFSDVKSHSQVVSCIKSNSNPVLFERFCFQTSLGPFSYRGNHNIYTPEKELQRQGSDPYWCVSEVNSSFKVSNFQPKKIIVPNGVNMNLVHAKLYAQNRECGRFPVYTWGCYQTSCPLFGSFVLRCSRPKFAIQDAELPKVVGYDLGYIESLFLLVNNPLTSRKRSLVQDYGNEDQLLNVFDTGLKVQKLAQVYSQFCTLQFLNLNLKEITSAYKALKQGLSISFDTKNRKSLKKVHELTDLWLPLIEKYFNLCNAIIGKIVEGQSVIISSGGPEYETDFTLVSLVQIMIDPYYRTLEGFCVLLGKDWVSYGYPFSDESNDWNDAVLFHFIHCIWTLLQQNVVEFQFNEEFLVFLMESFFNSQFGTFLHNSELEASVVTEVQRSFFLHVLDKQNRTHFENPLYSPGTSPKFPIIYGGNDIRLWISFILRWNTSVVIHESRFGSSIESKISEKALSIKYVTFSHYMDQHLIQLTSLTSLDISGQTFSSLPVPLALLTNLKQLSLEDNHILKISEVIPQHLKLLEKLSLKGNEISYLPQNFQNLTSLTELDLSSNTLKSLPSLSNLTNLTCLSLKQNKLKRIPIEMSKLVLLNILSIAENTINFICDGTLAPLTNLEKLSIANNQLIVLPDIGLQKHLTKLEVQGNRLFDLPDNLVTKCMSLVELNIGNNKIQFLPMDIGSLTNLKTLSFACNKITHIPESLSECKNLKHVIGSYNMIKDLPPSIVRCKELESIYLSYNKISKVPHILGSMGNLKALDLTSNKISHLPLTLGRIRKLELVIFGNPVDVLPPDSVSVVDVLKENLKQYSSEAHVKLMLIGDKGSGKTSLVKYLSQKWMLQNFTANEGPIKSVRISQTTLPTKRKFSRPILNNTISVSIWDIPGDHYYNRFLYGSRSIIIFTFDVSSTEYQFQNWMQQIKVFKKHRSCTIWFVGTHCGETDKQSNCELNMETCIKSLKKTFPHFEFPKPLFISNQSGEGLPEFQKCLEELIESQDFLDKKISNSFLTFEQFLLEHKQRVTVPTFDRRSLHYFAEMCGIRTSDIEKCCKQLQKFGSFFYNDNENTYTLIESQWTMSIISTFKESEHLTSGIMEQKHISTLGKNLSPQLLTDLLSVMEIAAPTTLQKIGIKRAASDGSQNILFFPLHSKIFISPTKTLSKYWGEENGNSFGRIIKLSCVPIGLFSRLTIKSMNQFTPITVWTHGFLLTTSKAEKPKEDKKKVLIKVEQQEKEEVVEWVIDIRGEEFDMTVDTLSDFMEICVKLLNEYPNVDYSLFIIGMQQLIPLKLLDDVIFNDKSYTINDQKIKGTTLVPEFTLPFYKGLRIGKYTQEDFPSITKARYSIFKAKSSNSTPLLLQSFLRANSDIESKSSKILERSFLVPEFFEFRRAVKDLETFTYVSSPVHIVGINVQNFGILYEGTDGIVTTLRELAKKVQISLSWSTVLNLLLELGKTLKIINEREPPFVIRNLSSSNVIIVNNGGIPTVKIVGYSGMTQGELLNGRIFLDSRCLAPEILANQNYDEKVDIYGFGVICYEVFNRSKFMPDVLLDTDVEELVLNGKRPMLPEFCPPRFRDIIEKCWSQAPDQRPDWGYIIKQLQSMQSNVNEIDDHLSGVIKDYISERTESFNRSLNQRKRPSLFSSQLPPLKVPHQERENFGFDPQTYKLFEKYLRSKNYEHELHFYNDVTKMKNIEQFEELYLVINQIASDYLGYPDSPPILKLKSEVLKTTLKKISRKEVDKHIFDPIVMKYKPKLDERAILFSEDQFKQDIIYSPNSKHSLKSQFSRMLGDPVKKSHFERYLKSNSLLSNFHLYLEASRFRSFTPESYDLTKEAKSIAKQLNLSLEPKCFSGDLPKLLAKIESNIKNKNVSIDLFDEIVEGLFTALEREYQTFLNIPSSEKAPSKEKEKSPKLATWKNNKEKSKGKNLFSKRFSTSKKNS